MIYEILEGSHLGLTLTQKAFLLAIVELSTHCLPLDKLVRHSVSITIKLCLQVFKINT